MQEEQTTRGVIHICNECGAQNVHSAELLPRCARICEECREKEVK